MEVEETYKSRVKTFKEEAEKLQKTANRLSLARLAVFVGGLILFVSLSSVSVFTAVTVLIVSLVVFGWLVIRHHNAEKKRTFFKRLENINDLELKCLEGDFSGYRTGAEYHDRDHPYSYDLDIFGKSSLFQYICRTTSKPASDLLAGYLKQPASIEETTRRQEGVAELKPMIEWRQKMMTYGYSCEAAVSDPHALEQWMQSDDYFAKPMNLRIISLILSALTLTTIILVVTGLPASLLAPVLAINFIYYFVQNKKITKLHLQVSRSSDLLKTYASIIGLMENEKFSSSKLTELQSVLYGETSASESIRRLSKLVSNLDSRLNVLVSIPLNLLFFNDIHCCLALEGWKRDHSGCTPCWFASMAEFEVISSVANMAFNNPDWVMPRIVPEYFTFRAEDAGHPLIPYSRRINNDIEISGEGKAVLVTGSNMSGKSTFLRTCGVNTVLALAGAPVCAKSFAISHMNVYSSMRIADSLEENISSFYAELRRLHSIITVAENDPKVFLLLDEILRGTNSNDRYTGSVALIKQLTGYGTVAMVATHDLRLTQLTEELPDRIDNYHFDVKVSGEELFFDYKLTPGVCASFNATLLMKKMGIRV